MPTPSATSPIYRFDNVQLPVERKLIVDGRPVAIGARAFEAALAPLEILIGLDNAEHLFPPSPARCPSRMRAGRGCDLLSPARQRCVHTTGRSGAVALEWPELQRRRDAAAAITDSRSK